jgi:hypothetical protein
VKGVVCEGVVCVGVVFVCVGVCCVWGFLLFLGGGVACILLDICPRGLRYSQIAELGLNLSGS